MEIKVEAKGFYPEGLCKRIQYSSIVADTEEFINFMVSVGIELGYDAEILSALCLEYKFRTQEQN